nr:MAG TPA: hypothetical protein [Caudoviricetes sp.]
MPQDQVDQLVARVMGLCGDFIEAPQCGFVDAHGNHAVSVLAATLDFQRLVIKMIHMSNSYSHFYFNCSLTFRIVIYYTLIVKVISKMILKIRFCKK